jgi:hypothetical protein
MITVINSPAILSHFRRERKAREEDPEVNVLDETQQ